MQVVLAALTGRAPPAGEEAAANDSAAGQADLRLLGAGPVLRAAGRAATGALAQQELKAALYRGRGTRPGQATGANQGSLDTAKAGKLRPRCALRSMSSVRGGTTPLGEVCVPPAGRLHGGG